MILPIITTPYISRVLHADGVGRYNYAFSVVSVSIIFAQLGTNMYGQREIAYVQNSRRDRSKVFWDIVFIRLITTIIVCPFYVCLAIFLKEYTSILIAMTIYLSSNILDFSWYFQGLEEFKKTALRSMASKVLGVIAIFCFVKSGNDVVLYAVILAISQLVGNLSLIPSLVKSVDKPIFNNLSIRKHIQPVIELFLPTAAIYVYTYIDKIILGVLTSDNEVGYYSQSEKIVKLLMTIVTSLGVVLLPHIATYVKEGKMDTIRTEITKAVSFVAMLGFPMVVGCIFIGDRFIPWFLGDGFDPSIFIFKLLSPLIIIIGLASIVGQAILIPLKKQKTYTASIFAGAGINLLINFVLIPCMGAVGASIGTLVAEFTVTSVQLYFVCKYISIDVMELIRSSWHYLPLTAVMGLFGVLLNNLLPNGFIYLIMLVAISCFFYFLMLFLIKDSLIFSLIHKRKKAER